MISLGFLAAVSGGKSFFCWRWFLISLCLVGEGGETKILKKVFFCWRWFLISLWSAGLAMFKWNRFHLRKQVALISLGLGGWGKSWKMEKSFFFFAAEPLTGSVISLWFQNLRELSAGVPAKLVKSWNHDFTWISGGGVWKTKKFFSFCWGWFLISLCLVAGGRRLGTPFFFCGRWPAGSSEIDFTSENKGHWFH